MRKLLLTASVLALGAVTMPASAETVRWARASDALTLDPHSQNQGVTHNFNHHIYETLLNRDVEGSLIPRLATEWFVKADDPNVWVFKLREGVKFHGGEDFTAEDVVFSLNRARSDKSNLRQLHADVADVVAVDDLTVEVKMNGPSPLYPNNITNTFIMDKGWSEANDVVEVQDFAAGEDNYAVRNTNGTGPYVLQSREPDVRSVLTAFDGHWADKPAVTEIIYLPIKEAATRVAALLSGEVDLVQDVPVQDIERLSGTSGVKIETGPENRIIYFGYKFGDAPLKSSNVTDKNPFNDPKVLEAMELAIDREAIKRVVMRGQSVPAGVATPPFVNGWTPELDAFPAPDVARAKELLAEAGYGPDNPLELTYLYNTSEAHKKIAIAVSQMWKQTLGVNVTLENQEWKTFLETRGNHDFEIARGAWCGDYNEASTFLDLVQTESGYNDAAYSNAEVDQLLKEAKAMDDPQPNYTRVEEILSEEMPVIPIYHYAGVYMMVPEISGSWPVQNVEQNWYSKDLYKVAE
jgi:peptide/nickel transport system substrate-binding protein